MTTLSYRDVSVESDTLSPKAVAYLLQYGWAQSLQDSIAGYAKELRDEHKDITEGEVTAHVNEALRDRAASIIDGTVGTRVGGPRKSPVEKEMFRLASAEYATAFKRKYPSADMPKGAALTEQVNKLIKARDAHYRKAAEATIARLAKVDTSVDDLI